MSRKTMIFWPHENDLTTVMSYDLAGDEEVYQYHLIGICSYVPGSCPGRMACDI